MHQIESHYKDITKAELIFSMIVLWLALILINNYFQTRSSTGSYVPDQIGSKQIAEVDESFRVRSIELLPIDTSKKLVVFESDDFTLTTHFDSIYPKVDMGGHDFESSRSYRSPLQGVAIEYQRSQATTLKLAVRNPSLTSEILDGRVMIFDKSLGVPLRKVVMYCRLSKTMSMYDKIRIASEDGQTILSTSVWATKTKKYCKPKT